MARELKHEVDEETIHRRRKNRQAIELYVTLLREAFLRSTVQASTVVIRGEEKGGSEPAISDAGMKLLEDEYNQHAHELLHPIIERWLRDWYPDSWYLFERAPLEIRKWQNKKTQEDRETLWRFNRALDEAERGLEHRFPGCRISVKVNPKAKPVGSRRESADRDKSLNAASSYRKLVRRLEAIEDEMGMPREKAKHELRARIRTEDPRAAVPSIGKINDAIAFVKRYGWERDIDRDEYFDGTKIKIRSSGRGRDTTMEVG